MAFFRFVPYKKVNLEHLLVIELDEDNSVENGEGFKRAAIEAFGFYKMLPEYKSSNSMILLAMGKEEDCMFFIKVSENYAFLTALVIPDEEDISVLLSKLD